jgi:hypothetical protein
MDGMSGTRGLPLLPPLPGVARPLTASGLLAALVTERGAAVLTAETGGGEAMVVLLDRHVAAAAAAWGREAVVTGDAALEALAGVPIERVRLLEVGRDVARGLRVYFMPDIVRGLLASSVAPEPFIRSFARPDQATCVIVEAEEDLGLVLLDGAGGIHAYTRSAGEVGGIERVARLLADPTARLTVRAGQAGAPAAGAGDPVPAAAPPPATAPARPAPSRPPADALAPPAGAPPAPPPPVPAELAPVEPVADGTPGLANGALAAFLANTAGEAAAGRPAEGPPADPFAGPSPPGPPPAPPGPDLLEAVLAEARSLLGRNAARIEDELRGVPASPDAIAAAVRALRDRGVRLISAATMDLLVERTDRVLERLAPDRPPGH